MGGDVTEEQAISHAQYLDLVYSKSRTLYDIIHQAPSPSMDPAKPAAKIPIDGVIGSIQPPSMVKPAKQPNPSTPAPSNPTVSTEVNTIQSMQSSGNKKKGKGKNKKTRKPTGKSQTYGPEE